MTDTTVSAGPSRPTRVPNCTPADKDTPDAPGLVHDWKDQGEDAWKHTDGAPNNADVYQCSRCEATSWD